MNNAITFINELIKNKRLKFTDKEELVKWQQEKLINHIKEIKKLSPFYKKYYKNSDVEKIEKLPLINKKVMMDNFDDLNTRGIQKEEAFEIALKSEDSRDFSSTIDDITIGLSSGTSGNRGLFLVSEKERIKWASVIINKVLPKPWLQRHKIAFFLRANSNLYTTVDKGIISFSFFDLMDKLENNIKKLNEYQPTILIAPASMLRFIAEKQNKGEITINPKKIVSVAEVLEETDKKYISKVFNQIVHQVYQCTEGFLGVTCKYGHIHLNEDMVYIEKKYLDDKRFIPIISDFTRTTQPIFKYELNDILVENKEQCPCGSFYTRIDKIEGRSDDIFYIDTKDGKTHTIFPDFIRRAIITASDDIEEYRAIQEDKETIVIELKGKINKDIQNNITTKIKQLFDINPIIDVQFKEYNLQPSSTKLRRIQSFVKK